jgi:large subunit ribosomal protein L14
MIYVGTKLNILDNSGAKSAICIRVLRKKCAAVGDTVLVAVQHALPDHRVEQGELHRAIILQTKKSYRRPDGGNLINDLNGAVLVSDKGVPIGTRVLAPVGYEIKKASKAVWNQSSLVY